MKNVFSFGDVWPPQVAQASMFRAEHPRVGVNIGANEYNRGISNRASQEKFTRVVAKDRFVGRDGNNINRFVEGDLGRLHGAVGGHERLQEFFDLFVSGLLRREVAICNLLLGVLALDARRAVRTALLEPQRSG